MTTTGKAVRIGGIGLLWGFVFLTLYGATAEFWRYATMRALPVEVLRSSLLIDAPTDRDGNVPEIVYTLRLDLATTDGGNRTIHWEDDAGKATYPEEAYDELRRWAPGTKHQVYQVRGEAQAIRLPGSSVEADSAIGLGVLAAVLFVVALMITGIAAEESALFRRWGLERIVGVWMIFTFVGVLALIGFIAFNRHRLPRILFWKPVVATVSSQPETFTADTLPRHVTMTPSAREALSRASYRVLSFPWNGQTLHAGRGTLGGVYDGAAANCPAFRGSCELYVNPENRWDAEPKPAFNKDYFVPATLMLLFGFAFTGAGLAMRRQRR